MSEQLNNHLSVLFSTYVPFVLFPEVVLLREVDQIKHGFRRDEQMFVQYFDLKRETKKGHENCHNPETYNLEISSFTFSMFGEFENSAAATFHPF